MITFLLALIHFVVTVALHVLQISIKVAIQALKISAKTAKVAVKQGAKVTKKVAKKGVKATKKTARHIKGKVKEDLTENTKPATQQTADVRDVITSEDDVKDKVQSNKGGFAALRKLQLLKILQKSVHGALVLSRVCMIAGTVFVFVLVSLLITSSLAIMSSAGYVALAYNNGVLGTNEDSDSSFDITKDGKDDKDSSNTNFVKGDTSTLEGKLETLAKWYIANIHTYGDSKYTLKTVKANDLMDGLECRNDCTGFARAFVNYVNGNNKTSAGGSDAFVKGWNATDNGWTYYETKDLKSLDDLQLGDILIANTANASKAGTISGKGHHAEVFIDKKHSFGWGKVQKEYPLSKDWNFTKNSQGRNVVTDSGHIYVCFYRHTGK